MFRKDLIPLLLDHTMSVTQIARQIAESPRDIEADVQHFLKSLRHTEYSAVITPAECRKCGFAFGEEKLRKPSKCPECQSTWLLEPTIELRAKKPGTRVSPPAATSDDRQRPKNE